MAISDGDVLRIDVLGTLFDQQIITTFAYRVFGSAPGGNHVTDCANIAGDFRAGTTNPFLAFLACCPPEYEAITVRVQDIWPVRYKAGTSDASLPGTNLQHATTPNLAAVVTRGSQYASRSAVGNVHIPGLGGTNVVDGKIANALLTLMSTFGSRMLNLWVPPSVSAVTLVPVIINPQRAATVTPPKPFRPFGTQDLYFTVPQTTARVMRRRTIGIGK